MIAHAKTTHPQRASTLACLFAIVGVVLVAFVLAFVATCLTLAGGVVGYALIYGAGVVSAMISTFLLSFDADIHPRWLRPGSATFVGSWACTLLVVGGGWAVWDATYAPNRSGWQLDSICGYFVYIASGPAVAVIFFKAHRDRAHQMLWALTSVTFGAFVCSVGQALKVAEIDWIGDIIYVGSLMVYMPLIVLILDKHRGVEECGRA